MSVTSLTKPKVLIVAGPTAAGKSALALRIAEECDGVLINADSQQRYRDLRILTARPSAEEEARVPHRLFGDLGPSDVGSAAEWAVKALHEIENANGKLPILVGGTGLYFRALTEGLTDIPQISDDVRDATRALGAAIGPREMHRRLSERDPVTAARLKPGDTQRVLRAWEVLEATGKPLSAWHENPPAPLLTAPTFNILVLPPREHVYAVCDARLKAMVANGALDEVRGLMASGIDPRSGAGKALGVTDLAAYLRGEQDLDVALNLAQTATRQYAKRQMTWFRNQFRTDFVVNAKFSERLLPEIFSEIRRFLLT